MACFDPGVLASLNDCWGFGAKLNQQLTRMTPAEAAAAYADIETHFDAHLTDPKYTVSVPFNYPGSWPSVIAPLYFKACRKDEEAAAMMLGNMYCRVAIRRPETWWSIPTAYIPNKSRHYILDSAVNRVRFGI